MTAIVPSYVAKANRAEKHLIDLEAEIERYAARKPYTVRTVEGKKQRKVRRLVFTADPANTDIPIIVADVVYNLRSALDHLMGAMHPRSRRTHVMFPIFFKGIWKAGPEGENLERTEQRMRWNTSVRGLPDEAIAYLKRLQPPDSTGDDRQFNRLVVINRLSNRDRHEKLPVVAAALRSVAVTVTMPDGDRKLGAATPRLDFFENKAEITGVPYPALDVEIDGAPVIVIRTSQKDANIEIPAELSESLKMVRAITERLVPYVRG
jgi:hypothetical protein